MAKRSRASSFPISEDEPLAGSGSPSTEPEEVRRNKVRVHNMSHAQTDKQIIQCSLPPHSGALGFDNLEEFEVHYVKEHSNRCVECGKNFPSAHFLALHIDEKHNPLREVLAAKGEKTYSCFLPECDRKCSTPQKRRLHMIDKHGFPKVYNFRIVDYGIDNASSLLHDKRRRRVSVNNDHYPRQHFASRSKTGSETQPEIDNPPVSDTCEKPIAERIKIINGATDDTQSSSTKISPSANDVASLEQSFAALQFIPRSVTSRKPADSA